MSKFRNVATGVEISVDDSKDDRYDGDLWEPAEADSSKKAPVKRVSSKSARS